MGKEQQKGSHSGKNRFKKQYNNYNPYNKLDLNRFHQIKDEKQERPNYSHQIHKKKRDLQRMIQYRKSKGLEIEQEKLDQLAKIETELNSRKSNYEREKRKQFFLQTKYKQIMNIEKRKVAKKLREIKSQDPVDNELLTEWLRKLNYIKHYPKTLKYVSLFPTSPMSEQAIEFQKKIMNDIEQTLSKKKKELNKFQTEYKKEEEKPARRKKRDDFFLQEQGQDQQNEEEVQEVQDQSEQQQMQSEQS